MPAPSPGDAPVALGIDIGGTGIKGALVDLARGALVSDRVRFDTPQPSTPKAVANTLAAFATAFGDTGPVGVTFPGVIRDGVVLTAANVDRSWCGVDLRKVASKVLPGRVSVLNDADAAGLAEARYGAGQGRDGLVLVITLGTGIGSALISHGQLVPNTELGHIEINGKDAELQAAASARARNKLSWSAWAGQVQQYLRVLERLIWPDLIILGGGVSKKPEKWFHKLDIATPLVLAKLLNNAGIIGAALAAAESAG